jgi:hypothetical protein
MPKPDLRLQVTDDYQVKMSYGLLMDLQRLLSTPEAAMTLVLTDPYTQDYVVRRVMTPSKATIMKMEDLVEADSFDLEPEQVERILTWVVQHILHFFAQRAAMLAKTGERFKTALPSLFTTGSANSTSETPSAGPSEPLKTT